MVSLRKNIIYSAVLTTANYIFPLLTYPYVSRVLGVDGIGLCNFIDSIINYFLILSSLGIATIGVREISRNKGNADSLQRTFSQLFTINAVSTTVALVSLLIAMYAVPRLHENLSLMWIGALKLVFNYLLIEWFYRGLEDFKYITRRTVAIRCLYVLSVFLFVKTEDDIVIYYFLISATIIINAIINIVYVRRFVRLKFCLDSLAGYAKSIVILGIYSILTSMYTTFNVAYLGFVSNDAQVGYYTTSTKVHTIILMAFSAVTGVLMPRMAAILAEKRYEEYERLIKRSVMLLLVFAIPCVILIEIFAPSIIKLIAGPDYGGAVLPLRIIAPLILVIGLEQILITQSLMPMGKDKAVLMNSVFGAFVGIVANVVLVPRLESVGSAIVWLISEVTVMSSAAYYFCKAWRGIRYGCVNNNRKL